VPRVFRPGHTRASAVRVGAEVDARRQIDQARYGQQLVLEIEQIEANPNNPRRSFSEEALKQLAESMKRDGQIQPVVVRKVGSVWQLIAGERRWRAARLAGIPTVSAVQREATDETAFRLALVENIHREDLSHQEKVEALDMLGEMVDGHGLRRTALELNMSPSWLSRRLSMRKDPVVFPALEEGRISFAQANELLAAPAVARRTLLDRVLRSRGRVPSGKVRDWVNDVRQQASRGQQRMVAEIASADMETTAPTPATVVIATSQSAQPSFLQLLAFARALGVPTKADEIAAVGQLVAYLGQLWEQLRAEPRPAPVPLPRRRRPSVAASHMASTGRKRPPIIRA
jgi:ParB/RepB/Spo0J family partition protein